MCNEHYSITRTEKEKKKKKGHETCYERANENCLGFE